jgi:trk system potassium uptake protein TrkH
MVGGYIHTFTDAFFETMSGFTTTGATIINNVEILPHGILFWRSLTHWIGGLGIVFFTIALLPSLVGGSVKVFAAESTGPLKSKLHPRLSTNAKSIWMVFLVITGACIISYHVFGMGWFDSVNYSMSTLGTGGFATHNDSIQHFHSIGLEYSSALFCLLSGANFALLYSVAAKLDIKKLFRNSEFKFYIIVILVSSIFIAAELVHYNGYGIERAFRSGLFQVVSLITTTGLYSDDAGKWPHITWVVLSICMFIGACSGSTSGGFKCVRGVMVPKILKNEFRQILHPNAVLPLKIDGINVSQQKRVTLLAFLVIYILLCLIASLIMIAYGMDDTNAITVALSSMSNVGPAFGSIIGPTMSWSTLPDFVKWMCSMLMLMGRLEIFTVLVIFTPSFWREN